MLPGAYLRMMYFALFQSINYGILLWGSSHHITIGLLPQNKVVRIIAFSNFRDHCRPLFSGQVGWLAIAKGPLNKLKIILKS